MPTLMPQPVFRPLDANGNVMPGAKLWSYYAGTTTLLATFAEDGSFNTNPVILDSTGTAHVRLGAAAYKMDLFDANNVHQAAWPVDNVTAGGGGTVLVQSTTVTFGVSTDNQAQIAVTNLIPANVDVIVVTTFILTGLGTSRGLTAVAIGDGTTIDRWGVQNNLTAGRVSGGTNITPGCTPPLTDLVRYPAPQSVMLSALGGAFDTAGVMQVAVQYLDLTHRMS